ncbi:MAG TPA: hypothetical protein VE684_01860 [Crenalkalicoccus sp.]|jgi:hypothetical protein|nr:hypothetical protein [Crenalkalicoccus sp.]
MPIESWMVSGIAAPIIAALFYMLHGLRNEMMERFDRSERSAQEAMARTREDLAQFKVDVARSYAPVAVHAQGGAEAREDLAAFKLEVARTYVPLSLIREVDGRLSQQLLRIETKLEEVARAAPLPRAREKTLLEDER